MERDLGVLVAGKLNMSQQCALVARGASCTPGSVRPSTAVCVREEIVLLCSVQCRLGCHN